MVDQPHNPSQQTSEEAALKVHSHPVASTPGIGSPAESPRAEDPPQPEVQTPPEPQAETPPADATPQTPQPESVAADEAAGQQPSDVQDGPADEPTSQAAEEPAPQPEEEEIEARGPIEETPVVEEPPKMDWYILKVQSNREDSIRESLKRRVAVAGLDRFFGEIIVPTEMVSEFKGGKKRVVKRKLYPGYLVVNMEINEDTWFLVRETPGIGDFTGSAGKPTPMAPHEVSKIIAKQEEKAEEAPKLKISFNVGDRVKINEGTFENFEGEVDGIDEASGRVTVMINIFGRSTPVELEYWQIESI